MIPKGLEQFHPAIGRWFADRVGTPTDVQQQSWPLIAAGEHVLVTAPTGSGKTLTAFLWALNRFASGACAPGHTRVLYVSPLKALNNDIQRNLLDPLSTLHADHGLPALRVQTRSGDTGSAERQRMLRRPPDILITTPESLVLMLTTARGRQALATVETVILDEIHALVDNRRGVALLTGLERLVEIAGEVQRIALSATVRPLGEVARYLGGVDSAGRERRVRVVDSQTDKALELSIRYPEEARAALEAGAKLWDPLAADFRESIASHRSTLLFTNSRRLAERITLKINEGAEAPLAYAHHGSLSREIRSEVERRMKAGELKAIVATSSLEMGIDIGALDQVVMVQSPGSVAATLQRLGRAGHQVGETSRGALYPTHANDFLEAAALAEAVAARDIEPVRLLEGPLDVLAQILVSACASETWRVDDLFAVITRAGPYRGLDRRAFDLVLDMLVGRYEGSRVRELKARLSYDRLNGTIRASRGAVLALYNAGGVIPDRGYYKLRHADQGTVIGELDEEFVFEATVGQQFTLGSQAWRIQRITHSDVLVVPGSASAPSIPPFWRAEDIDRSTHYSEKIGLFLRHADDLLASGDVAAVTDDLTEGRRFEPAAARELVDYLVEQRQQTGRGLPHRDRLLVEYVAAAPGGYRGPMDASQIVIHSFWGGGLNRPWALAMAAAWQAEFGEALEINADNDAIVLQPGREVSAETLLALVRPDTLEALLRRSLEGSGYFGARFREAAGRALLLTRQRFNQRLPLWLSRLQAKKLMTAVRDYEDFPMLLETWRSCLVDGFDLATLRQRLADLADGVIDWQEVRHGTPSPFAARLSWDQIFQYMYADDTPERRDPTALDEDLIRAAIQDPTLRPRLQAEVIAEFETRRQRREPGYEPVDADDWLDWVRERVLIPAAELDGLSDDAAPPEHANLVWLTQEGRRWLTHRELLGPLRTSGLAAGADRAGDTPELTDGRDAVALALEVLSFYGPLDRSDIDTLLPSVPAELGLDSNEPAEGLVGGRLRAGDDSWCWCDEDNLESLLRLQRARSRPQLETRPVDQWPGFAAAWQGLGAAEPGEGDGAEALDLLRGWPAPLDHWESALLPARLPGYSPAALDTALRDTALGWRGTGDGRIRFAYPDEDALFADPRESTEATEALRDRLAGCFVDPAASYDFLTLADRFDGPLPTFNALWWQALWQGLISADGLDGLRDGARQNYELASSVQARQSARGSRGGRRRPAQRVGLLKGWTGPWRLLPAAGTSAGDELDALEDAKDRARLLLDRYGVLTRELANREAGPLRWAPLFRALRALELAGEAVSGLFFEQFSGPQFALPAAVSRLGRQAPPPAAFWLNAQDPLSPCGLGLDWPELPTRRPGNWLAFERGELVLVAENAGRRLRFSGGTRPPDRPAGTATDAELPAAAAALLRHLAGLRRGGLAVTEIDGESARASPWLASLSATFEIVRDHKQITLNSR